MARSFILSSALLALNAAAQTGSPYTDEKSGIAFNGLTHASGFRYGVALPENPTTDFIGQIVAPVGPDAGWGGISTGQSMTGNLLVVAWQHEGEIVSSFRKATGYTSPAVTEGDFTLSTIPEGTYVNDTAFTYTFLCSNCLGENGMLLSDTTNVLGWAYADEAVTDPASASSALTYHSAGFGAFGLTVADAQSADYDTWAALAVSGSGGNSTAPVDGGNSTAPAQNTTAVVSDDTYDYIVAGAGAAGIVVAERLAESGASVLLLERGGASLAFTGNNDTMSFNSSMTMYDVPGVDYYLSEVGSPALCTDTADQAGCLLGGSTSINAMMFVKPQKQDFDANWPEGWKWTDVSAAADRVWEINPGQNYGSMDGVRYNNEAYDVLAPFFESQGWAETHFIEDPHSKRNVYGYPPWNTANGLRSGVVRTYLPLAQQQSNFKLEMHSKVLRAVREGSAISGVETENEATGERIIYNVNEGGSVILSAGSMSTPRILFNSGIGPSEQLQSVASGTSGVTLPAEDDWIDLPVGAEIKDHTIFTVKFNTTSDMYSSPSDAVVSPNQTTVDLFAKGSGLLAQSGQRLNWWTSLNTTEGKEVYFQGTCNGPAENTIQMKIYITHGTTSVGSLGITASGATTFITEPWMTSDSDIEAATMMMDQILEMANAPNSTLKVIGSGNVTGADLIKEFKTASHFVGTAKMGTEGEAGVVVDTDTKVYGTDNLFVVDASMHPDLPTGNTQAIVMVAAEAAASRILSLGGNSANETAATPVGTGSPVGTGITQPSNTGVPATSSEVPSYPVESVPAQSSEVSSAPVDSSPTQPTQTAEAGNGNPWWQPPQNGQPNPWWAGPNNQADGKATTLETQAATPTPSRSKKQKRTLPGKIPVSPDSFDDEDADFARSEKTRASFLDAYIS